MNNNRRKFLKKIGMAGAASAIVPAAFAGAEQKSFAQMKRNTEVPVNMKLV